MIRSALAALLATIATAAALAGPPVYKIELVPNRDGLHPGTAPAISPRGEVAGGADEADGLGVAYRSRQVVTVNDAINDAGQISGIGILNGHYRAYVASRVPAQP